MKLFDQLLTDSLRRAFIESEHRSLRVSDAACQELSDYIMSEQLEHDIASLRAGNDPFLPPKKAVKKCGSKTRVFYCACGTKKFFLKYLYFALHDAERPYVSNACSSDIGPGLVSNYKKLIEADPRRCRYVLVGDVRRYSESLNEEVVLTQVKELLPGDTEAQDFIMQAMFPNEYTENGKLVHEHVLAGAGHILANLIMNIYLAPVDKALAQGALAYSRFFDDFVAVYETREQAEQAFARMQEITRELKLELHPTKSRIVEPGQPYSYLELWVTSDGVDFSESQIATWKNYIRKSSKQLMCQVQSGKMPGQLAMRLFAVGVDKFVLHNQEALLWMSPWLDIITKTDGIKRLDCCVRDCMRSIGSGKKGAARYRITYQDLKRAGYKNLIHIYYHRDALKREVFGNDWS